MAQVVKICCKPEIFPSVFNYVMSDYLKVQIFKTQLI
jgi:hypothetical protein